MPFYSLLIFVREWMREHGLRSALAVSITDNLCRLRLPSGAHLIVVQHASDTQLDVRVYRTRHLQAGTYRELTPQPLRSIQAVRELFETFADELGAAEESPPPVVK